MAFEPFCTTNKNAFHSKTRRHTVHTKLQSINRINDVKKVLTAEG